jgi:hypothetical protein
MRAVLRMIASRHAFVFKISTEIFYNIGPKKRERFHFSQIHNGSDWMDAHVTGTILKLEKKGESKIITTRDSVYEFKKLKK